MIDFVIAFNDRQKKADEPKKKKPKARLATQAEIDAFLG